MTEQKARSSTDASRTDSHVGPDSAVQRAKDLGIFPVPRHLRYDSAKPPKFGLGLNIAFAVAACFTAANLSYCTPLLVQLSDAFHVDYGRVADIPSLVSAGYGAGLLLISPLGDLLRRRQILLSLMIIATMLTIGLAITKSLRVFQALSFLVSMSSVTPQIVIPLATDLASDNQRATAMSIVYSGLLLGTLIGRVFAGLIAQFVSWRVVYWYAVGVQSLVLVGTYFLLVDYPAKNKNLTYFRILYSMAKFAVTEPALIQGYLMNMLLSLGGNSFWVTLTFLLDGAPYHYSTLVIGLFGIIGVCGSAMSPVAGYINDHFAPWYGALLALLCAICFQSILVGAGGIHIAAVIIPAIGLEAARQLYLVSTTSRIFAIAPEARARLNAVMILAFFIGNTIGPPAGTAVYVKFGWRATYGFQMGLYGLCMLLLFLRGPHCTRYTWFGFEGGFGLRKTADEEEKVTGPYVESAITADEVVHSFGTKDEEKA